MPVNKKALTRYLAYDRLLRNRGRKYTWQDLIDVANRALEEEGLKGIGKTQFYADMIFMQCSDWKAPIETDSDPDDQRIKYYSYADPEYSISNQPLSETETEHLRSAIMVLSRFKGMPQFEWVSEVIPAIETKLGLIHTEKEVIAFDSNIDYLGLAFITPLFNAIVNKRVLTITYQDFRSPVAYDVEFHPYYLKQFNNRWFSLGYSGARACIQNLALDRIKSVQETRTEYIHSPVDWEEYFFDVIGVTIKASLPVDIRFLIRDEEQAAYIRTKPLHATQKPLRQVTGGYESSIRVIPNYELEKLFLSFGERIEILEPEDLRARIRERIREMYKNYTGLE